MPLHHAHAGAHIPVQSRPSRPHQHAQDNSVIRLNLKVTASDFQRDIKVLLGSEGESAGFDLGPQNEKLRGSFLGDLKSPLAVFNWEWAVM